MAGSRRAAQFMPECPDCGAAVGQTHYEGCDVERCGWTGRQRLSCTGRAHPGAACRPTAWDGYWPGTRDCERLGFWTAGGAPDLNRLYGSGEAAWDAGTQEWRLVTP